MLSCAFGDDCRTGRVRMKTEGRNVHYEANAGSQVRERVEVWSIIVAGQMERNTEI